jgi:hypothetical protein
MMMVTWINLPQRKASKHKKRGRKKTARIGEGMPGTKGRE